MFELFVYVFWFLGMGYCFRESLILCLVAQKILNSNFTFWMSYD